MQLARTVTPDSQSGRWADATRCGGPMKSTAKVTATYKSQIQLRCGGGAQRGWTIRATGLNFPFAVTLCDPPGDGVTGGLGSQVSESWGERSAPPEHLGRRVCKPQ